MKARPEVIPMMCGPEAVRSWVELRLYQRQAEMDAELLKRGMSADEALEIWERNFQGLRWLAETLPGKRAEIEVMLEERRAVMRELVGRWR